MGMKVARSCLAITLGWMLAACSMQAEAVRQPDATTTDGSVTRAGWVEAWRELPAPPGGLMDRTVAWDGGRFIVVGGHLDGKDSCSDSAYAFDGSAWAPIASPPEPRCGAIVVPIGNEVLLVSGYGKDVRNSAVAYEAATDSWRKIARPPSDLSYSTAWTGHELLAWGTTPEGQQALPVGASYDPTKDEWTPLPEAPIRLTLSDGVWTGEEFIAFGSELNGRNQADTPTSVGAAFDPKKRTWRELPPSELSAQATAASWDGQEMIAWDYETTSEAYDPARDHWSKPERMPMDFSECYPEDVEIGGEIFAWFCGQASLWRDGGWIPVDGGPMDVTVHAYDRPFPVYRFMDMAPSDNQIFFQATGVAVQNNGTVCYGCKGAPTSYWMLTPSKGPIPCPDPGADGLTPTLDSDTIAPKDSVMLSGAAPVVGDDGDYVGPHGELTVWINLDPKQWRTGLPGKPKPEPAVEGKPVMWASQSFITGCDYSVQLTPSPRRTAGTYPVVAIVRDGDDATLLPPIDVTIAEREYPLTGREGND